MHGVLVPAGRPEAIASALVELPADAEARAAMGAAALERQRREFDFSRMVGELEELYVRLCDESRSTDS